jgi:hypothetical protein
MNAEIEDLSRFSLREIRELNNAHPLEKSCLIEARFSELMA